MHLHHSPLDKKNFLFKNAPTQKLSVETTLEGKNYRIKAGDTLSEIANKHKPQNIKLDVAIKAIQNLNGIKDASKIQAGRTIQIPSDFSLDKFETRERIKKELGSLKKVLKGKIEIKIEESISGAREKGKIKKILDSKSIVDMLNYLNVNSSFSDRKNLYKELFAKNSPEDSAKMNIQLLKKIQEMVDKALMKKDVHSKDKEKGDDNPETASPKLITETFKVKFNKTITLKITPEIRDILKSYKIIPNSIEFADDGKTITKLSADAGIYKDLITALLPQDKAEVKALKNLNLQPLDFFSYKDGKITFLQVLSEDGFSFKDFPSLESFCINGILEYENFTIENGIATINGKEYSGVKSRKLVEIKQEEVPFNYEKFKISDAGKAFLDAAKEFNGAITNWESLEHHRFHWHNNIDLSSITDETQIKEIEKALAYLATNAKKKDDRINFSGRATFIRSFSKLKRKGDTPEIQQRRINLFHEIYDKNEDGSVKGALIRNLKYIDASFEQAKPLLDKAIESKDEKTKQRVIHELFNIKTTFEQARPFLDKAMESKDEKTKQIVVFKLGLIGATFEQAKPFFEKAMKSKDEKTKQRVIYELFNVKPTFEQAKPFLDKAMKGNNEETKQYVIYVLKPKNATFEQAKPFLEEAMKSTNEEIKSKALYKLARFLGLNTLNKADDIETPDNIDKRIIEDEFSKFVDNPQIYDTTDFETISALKEGKHHRAIPNVDKKVVPQQQIFSALSDIAGLVGHNKIIITKLKAKFFPETFLQKDAPKLFKKAIKNLEHIWDINDREKKKQLIVSLENAIKSIETLTKEDLKAKTKKFDNLTKEEQKYIERHYDLIFSEKRVYFTDENGHLDKQREAWNGVQKFCYRQEQRVPGAKDFLLKQLKAYKGKLEEAGEDETTVNLRNTETFQRTEPLSLEEKKVKTKPVKISQATDRFVVTKKVPKRN